MTDATIPAPEEESKDIVRPSSPRMDFTRTFELLTKGWVLLLAAIYASGYVVVSIYHASLGLNEANPLRPKVAAAGLLFIVLVTGAVFILRYATRWFNNPNSYESESQRRRLSNCCTFLFLYVFDFTASNAVIWMMRYGSDDPNGMLFLVVLLTGAALTFLATTADKNKPRQLRLATHWSILSLCVITTLALVALSAPVHGEFGSRQFALFLGAIQLAALEVSNLRSKNEILRQAYSNWQVIIATMLAPLILFGLWVYPHTKAAFGGGEPSVAAMSILAASGSGTPTTVPVKIIDETDAGFYVIEENDNRVRYIPRNLVTSVIFDKPKGLF